MSDTKITNVIGVPIPQWLVEQFRVRGEKGNIGAPRSNQDLVYYANKTAWVRVVSSVQIFDEDNRYFSKFIENVKTTNYFVDGASQSTTGVDSLAKNFILYAGTSKYNKGKDGSGYSQTLKSGINGGAYGMLGKNEVSSYGYTPMPGIVSVNIETMGKMGSVRAATVNFRAFNKFQLDIIDALYFKLGYTMLLEWGHTYYYKSPPNVKDSDLVLYSTEELMVDPFVPNITKEQLQYEITTNSKKSYGNYDGMLGIITNFNFTRKEDGSYDCSIKMIALGSLAESLKVNRSESYPDILKDEIKKLVDYENSEQRKKRAAEIAEAKKIRDSLNAASAQNQIQQKKTLDQYYEEKIKASADTKTIQDYYFYASDGATDIYYKQDPSWALRKYGTILKRDTDIQKITLKKPAGSSFFAAKLGIQKNPKFVITQRVMAVANANDEPEFKALPVTSAEDFADKVEKSSEKWSTLAGLDSQDWEPYSVYFNTLSAVTYYYVIVIKKIKGNLSFAEATSNNPFEITKEAKKLAALHAFTDADPTSINVNDPTSIQIIFGDEKDNSEVPAYPYIAIKNKIKPELISQKIKGLSAYIDGLDYYLITNDSAYIGAIVLNPTEEQKSIKEYSDANPIAPVGGGGPTAADIQYEQDLKTINEKYPSISVSAAQSEEAGKFNTSLEVALRLIQVYSLNKSTQQNKKVVRVDFLTDDEKVAKAIFGKGSLGLYVSYYDQITEKKQFAQPPTNYGIKSDSIKNVRGEDLLGFYIKYGFNCSLLSNAHTVIDNQSDDPLKQLEDTEVRHKDLLESYVLPFNVNQEFSQGITLERPVYIKFGTFIMIINNLALMYDAKSGELRDRTPMFYVDYNPNTNYCMTSLNHLSVDPLKFMIPYSGNSVEYKKLFAKEIITELEKDKDKVKLFDNAKDDSISKDLIATAPFMAPKATKESLYQGKLMNVLVSIDYLLSTISRFSSNDNNNSVYFKPMMESIISDLGKALGNYNLLRLAYSDAGNCYHIVDDQLVPPDSKEKKLHRTSNISNESEIPLHGKTSIAKTLEIKTDISSKLANMIAISANSQNNQSTMGLEGSSFGFVNRNFTDRYAPLKADLIVDLDQPTTSSKKPTQGDIENAKKFNEAVKSFYGSVNVQTDYVGGAINYYISRMNNIKSNNPATRASAIIPVSVNFSTDGIAALHMYQAFTVNEELLPYTYAVKKRDEDGYLKKVGFVIVGLSHTIENNVWNTSVRANMIFLRDTKDYEGERKDVVYVDPPVQPTIRNNDVAAAPTSSPSPASKGMGKIAVAPDVSSIPDSELDIIVGPFTSNTGTIQELVAVNSSLLGKGLVKPLILMIRAAKSDNVDIRVTSGFRSPYTAIDTTSSKGNRVRASSQKYLYDLYRAGKGNVAAEAGKSPHGREAAVDLNVGSRNPKQPSFKNGINAKVFQWLITNAYRFGFVRTVVSEEWHWEYKPGSAQYQYVPRNNVQNGVDLYGGFDLG